MINIAGRLVITVSAKALWWGGGAWAAPMYLGEIDGWGYITDQFSLMPVARLGELPVGYGHVLELKPLPGQALDGFAEWLTATVLPDPSPRLFASWRIDPLEKAGFLIRPLSGVKEAHGICDPDLALVGLVIPLRRGLEPDDARVAATQTPTGATRRDGSPDRVANPRVSGGRQLPRELVPVAPIATERDGAGLAPAPSAVDAGPTTETGDIQ